MNKRGSSERLTVSAPAILGNLSLEAGVRENIAKIIAAVYAELRAVDPADKPIDQIGILQARISDIDKEFLARCGLENMDDLPIDAERMLAFKKEGKFEIDEDGRFEIVIDGEGQRWLLKRHSMFEGEDSEKSYKLILLRCWQSEVFLYRLGQLIGYPVEETKMVFRRGLPCTAYRYMGDDIAWPEIKEREPSLQLENEMDAKCRFMFNLLAGLRSDSAFQGVVANNKYYAGDMTFDPSEVILREDWWSEEGFFRDALRYMSSRLEGMVEVVNELRGSEPMKAYITDFIKRAKSLTRADWEGIFSDFIGSDEERNILVERFLIRPALIERLMIELKIFT